MNISDWLAKNFTHIVVTDEPLERTLPNGTVIKIAPNPVNRNLTMGLLSTNNKEEWSRIVFHEAPVGIVVDEISDEYYNDKLILLRKELTSMLFTAKNTRLIEQYLKILERRDSEHWSANSTKGTKIDVKTDTEKNINITFEVVQ